MLLKLEGLGEKLHGEPLQEMSSPEESCVGRTTLMYFLPSLEPHELRSDRQNAHSFG